MDDKLEEFLLEHHGVIKTAELRELGISAYATKQLIAERKLRRHKRGWYCRPSNTISIFGKARVAGGLVTCISALKHLGFWTPKHKELHLRLPDYDKRDDRHCLPELKLPESDLDTYEGILLCAQQCCEIDELVAILDELKKNNIDFYEVTSHKLTQGKLKRALALAGGRADSTQESLLRARLQLMGIKFQTHVKRGVFELDFLIGDYLAIELDSFTYHSDQQSLIRDRKKDRYFESLGYTMLRFPYLDVIERWDKCKAQILAMVRAEKHRYPTSRRVSEFANAAATSK